MPYQTGSRSASIIAVVFTLGLALGLGWKLGLIPVSLTTTSGSKLDEQSGDEDTDVAADEDAEVLPPPLLTAEQAEPPVEEGENWKSDAAAKWPRSEHEPPPYVRSSKSRGLRSAGAAERVVQTAAYQDEPAADDIEEPADESDQPKRIEVGALPTEIETPDDRFAEIDAKLAKGELLAAHKLLSKLYWNAKVPDDELQHRLDETAKKIFFSPQPHFIEPYVIQPGDQLRKIAGKYGLSWEYLADLNKTDPKRIREGQKLKVLKGPFAAIVTLHDFSLTIHLQGYYVKRYQVGIGKDGSSPIGKFVVLDKIENPQYTDPDGKVFEGDDPANPLGERWIDLGDSYGIHGTIDPESIGKAESRGCIRLNDADIIKVYDFLVKNSVVEIRE